MPEHEIVEDHGNECTAEEEEVPQICEEDLESFEPGDDEEDDELFDPAHQLTQLLVTEAGVPIVDVLQGIQDALDKQNKILYKLVSVAESKSC